MPVALDTRADATPVEIRESGREGCVGGSTWHVGPIRHLFINLSPPNTGIQPPAVPGRSAAIPCSAHRRWDNALEQPGLGHDGARAPRSRRLNSGAGRGGSGGQGGGSRRHGRRGPTERFCDKG